MTTKTHIRHFVTSSAEKVTFVHIIKRVKIRVFPQTLYV